MKIITYVTDTNNEGFKKLRKSCPEIIALPEPLHKTGTPIRDKVLATYEFVKGLDDDEIVIFLDGYDVVKADIPISEGEGELTEIIFNAEKALWTADLSELKEYYPEYEDAVGWNYLNSGCYMGAAGKLKPFLALWNYMLTHRTCTVDDQSAAQVMFMASKMNIEIDTDCYYFQCYSFVDESEYEYLTGFVHNKKSRNCPVFIHGNGKTDMWKVHCSIETGFDWLCQNYEDTVNFHRKNKSNFDFILNSGTGNLMNGLKEIRKFVTDNVWGFGEDCFSPMWFMLFRKFEFKRVMEIGCFKGASLAAWQYCSRALNLDTKIVGVGLFERGGNIPDWDFSTDDVWTLYNKFNLEIDNTILVKGNSQNPDIVSMVRSIYDTYDMVYIDGDHSYEGALSDLRYYAPMVKRGGILVIDDCANDTQVPEGFFGGIQTVTDALNDYLAETKGMWSFCFSLVHIKVYIKN